MPCAREALGGWAHGKLARLAPSSFLNQQEPPGLLTPWSTSVPPKGAGRDSPHPHLPQNPSCMETRGGGQSDPAPPHRGTHRHTHLLLPCLSPSCHQSQGEEGRAMPRKCSTKPRVCPGSFGYPVSGWPGLLRALPRPGTTALATPLPASKPARPEGAGRLLSRQAQPCSPGRRPQCSHPPRPPPGSEAPGLWAARSPGRTESTCSHTSFQETESLRQMTAVAAGQSAHSASTGAGRARPGGRLPHPGPPAPGYRPLSARAAQTTRPSRSCGWDGGLGHASPWMPRIGVRRSGEGAEALSHLQSLTDHRLPGWAQGTLRASLRGGSPRQEPTCVR